MKAPERLLNLIIYSAPILGLVAGFVLGVIFTLQPKYPSVARHKIDTKVEVMYQLNGDMTQLPKGSWDGCVIKDERFLCVKYNKERKEVQTKGTLTPREAIETIHTIVGMPQT